MRNLPSSIAEPTDLFQAIGDPTRREIVRRLAAGGPHRTGPLLEGLGLTRQGASRHLATLEAAGWVIPTKQGREVVRSLNPETLAQASKWLEQREREWDAALGRLAKTYEAD